MRTLKLFGTGTATANAVASVIIPSASTIRGVQVSVRIDSITDNAAADLEVSRASASEINILGAQQCIAQVTVAGNFVTSGLAHFGINQFLPVAVPVTQGQLIYLHAAVGGTCTYAATFILHYD